MSSQVSNSPLFFPNLKQFLKPEAKELRNTSSFPGESQDRRWQQVSSGRAASRLQLLRICHGSPSPVSVAHADYWQGLNGDISLARASLPKPGRHMACTWPWFIPGKCLKKRSAGEPLLEAVEGTGPHPSPAFRGGKLGFTRMERLFQQDADAWCFPI